MNTDLVPNYADIIPALKDKPWNTFDGVHYGIPHGRGANLLMWRPDLVDPAPANWAAMFDPSQPFAGKVSVYDAPIYIADAAVVLMKTQPDLGITNPYALDQTQFDAAVALLKQQRPMVSQFWADYTKQIEAFAQGDATVGTTWQINANLLASGDPPTKVETDQARGGLDGLVGHVDDQLQDQAPQLRLPVHQPHRLAARQRQDRRLLRRGTGEREVVRAHA